MDNHPTLITLHDPDFLVTLMPTHEGPLGGLVEPPVVAFRTANFAFHKLESDDRTVRVVATVEAAAAAVISEATLVNDRSKIERAVREDILQSSRHPQIRWDGTLHPLQPGTQRSVRFDGLLEIRGKRIPATLTLHQKPDGFWHAESEFRQTEFGIEPVSTLLGGLRSSDRVHFHVRLNPARLDAVWAKT